MNRIAGLSGYNNTEQHSNYMDTKKPAAMKPQVFLVIFK